MNDRPKLCSSLTISTTMGNDDSFYTTAVFSDCILGTLTEKSNKIFLVVTCAATEAITISFAEC